MMYQLHSNQPLFRRAIVMSGSYFLTPPLPLSVHEGKYKQAITGLGLADTFPDERVRALIDIPAQELESRLPPSVIAIPAIDGDIVVDCLELISQIQKNGYPKGKVWYESLLVGDAEMDVSNSSLPGCRDGEKH